MSIRYLYKRAGIWQRDFFFIYFIKRILTLSSFYVKTSFWAINSSITTSISSLFILVAQVRAMKSYIESVSGCFFLWRIWSIASKIRLGSAYLNRWSSSCHFQLMQLSVFQRLNSCHYIPYHLVSLCNVDIK